MPLLDIQSVTKRFGGLTAIHDVSLQIKQGEIMGLIGPNGAGKTTLFNLVSGFYPVDSGEVLFRTRRSPTAPYECCRLGIGRTFQTVKTFAKHDVLQRDGRGPSRMKGVRAQESALEILSFVGLAGKRTIWGRLTLADRKRLRSPRPWPPNQSSSCWTRPWPG
jgi:branched-chain amino acid transport system ATP-binding protein